MLCSSIHSSTHHCSLSWILDGKAIPWQGLAWNQWHNGTRVSVPLLEVLSYPINSHPPWVTYDLDWFGNHFADVWRQQFQKLSRNWNHVLQTTFELIHWMFHSNFYVLRWSVLIEISLVWWVIILGYIMWSSYKPGPWEEWFQCVSVFTCKCRWEDPVLLLVVEQMRNRMMVVILSRMNTKPVNHHFGMRVQNQLLVQMILMSLHLLLKLIPIQLLKKQEASGLYDSIHVVFLGARSL